MFTKHTSRLISFAATMAVSLSAIAASPALANAATPASENPRPNSAVAYNRDAAVNWALSDNKNDGKFYGASLGRWCATYIGRALKAGGLNTSNTWTSNGQVVSWMKANTGSWEDRPLSQLEKGDFVLYSNDATVLTNWSALYSNGQSHWGHSTLVTKPGRVASWNAEAKDWPIEFNKAKFPYTKGVHIRTETPQPPATGPAIYALQNVNSGMVLDVPNSTYANGARIVQWTFSSSKANQRWLLESVANSTGYYFVRSQLTGKCLDLENGSTANLVKIIQWTCHGGQTQQWQLLRQSDGSYIVRNRASGKVLDVPNFSKAQGVQIVQYGLNGGSNQRFRIIQQ